MAEYILGHTSEFRTTNHSSFHIEISHYNEDLKNLCKIHFHSKTIANKDYLVIPHKIGWSDSLSSQIDRSPKMIEAFILDLEEYIELNNTI